MQSTSSPPWGGATNDRWEQMFPTLSTVQMAELEPFGTQRVYEAGEILWNIGDRNVDFFLVIEGRLDIVRRDAFGADTVIVAHAPGRYSGETATLTGRGSMLCGRAGTTLTVLAIPIERLREVMITHARLGEIIMRSFILRRMRLISGFPTGISGGALAGRAFMQAQKFGAKIMIPARLRAMSCGNPYHELDLDTGDTIRCRFVVIASGAKYGKPALANIENLEGAGVYYGATYLESQLCRGEEIAIVGGGNSAGQAAVYLAETAKKVFVIVRSEGLAASMSQYLIRRIETTRNIELLTRTEVVELEGETSLQAIRWRNSTTGEETRQPVRHLFVFIGAMPNADFLPSAVLTDSKGFICTGADVTQPGREHFWQLARAPYPLETSCPGVFAAGDVRATSTKRVASAVGEGSVVVQFVHQLLAAGGA